MARTPKTRGKPSEAEAQSVDNAGEPIQPAETPVPEDAPPEFAASESLTPDTGGNTGAASADPDPMVGEAKAVAEPPASPEDSMSQQADPLPEFPVDEPPTVGADDGATAFTVGPEAAEEEIAPLAEPPALPGESVPQDAEAAAGFAASESLTPGENATIATFPDASPPSPTDQQAEAPPEALDIAAAPVPLTSGPDSEGSIYPPGRPDETLSRNDAGDPFRDVPMAELEGPGIAAAPVTPEPSETSGSGAKEAHATLAVENVTPGIAAAAFAPEPGASPSVRDADHGSPAPVAPAKRSAGGLFAAGLLGGLAALLLAGLLQFGGFLPAIGASSSAGADTQAFQSEIDGLKAEVAALRQAAPAAAAPDPALASRVDALQSELAQLKSAGSAAVPPELETRLAAAEQKLAGLDAGASTEQLAAASDKAAAAETLAQANAAAIKDTAGRVAALEQGFSGVQGSVADLQTSVADMRKGMETLQAQPRVALSLAGAALREAVDRGAPFTGELATFGTLSPDAPEVAHLQPYAESGVPTRAALLSDWNASVDAVLASENPPDENAGIMSRLWSGAGNLVSVRPIGAAEGANTSAIVGRIQAALEAGDLGKAMAEFDSLPDAAKQMAAGFAEKARARLAVEGLVDGAITNAAKAA